MIGPVVEFIEKAQGRLTEAQSLPLVGPILFSPFKILLSVVEIVVGVASLIFNTLIYTFTQFPIFDDHYYSLVVVIIGLFHLGLAIFNILTLGVIGYLVTMK